MGRSVFHLKIYAEDGVFYEGPCGELILPCVDGEKAFLPHHEDAVYAVYNGTLRFLVPEEASQPSAHQDREKVSFSWREAVIGKGVTHFSDNSCVVLAETAERPDEIDENRARAALERAKEKLQRELSMREYRVSQMAMARAMARIRAASRREQR